METQTKYTHQERIDAIASHVDKDLKDAFTRVCEAVEALKQVCDKLEKEGADPILPEFGDMRVLCLLQVDRNEKNRCVRLVYANGRMEPLKAEALAFAYTGEFL
jgi:hypothetical protein